LRGQRRRGLAEIREARMGSSESHEVAAAERPPARLPPPLDGAERTAPWPVAERFLGLSDEQLGAVDPVVLNLAVARGIPAPCLEMLAWRVVSCAN